MLQGSSETSDPEGRTNTLYLCWLHCSGCSAVCPRRRSPLEWSLCNQQRCTARSSAAPLREKKMDCFHSEPLNTLTTDTHHLHRPEYLLKCSLMWGADSEQVMKFWSFSHINHFMSLPCPQSEPPLSRDIYSFAGGSQVPLDGRQGDVHQSVLENLLPHCTAVVVILLERRQNRSIRIISNCLLMAITSCDG